MDPLSVSASIIALLQLSSTVIGYLSDVKDGPRELQRLRLEVCSILPILSILQDEAEQAKSGSSWSSTLLSLDVPNGPIQQFRASLEQLNLKLATVKGWKKVGKIFTWPFEKDEILRILDTIERQKLLFTLARQNDHMALAKAIKSDVTTVNKNINEVGEGLARLDLSDKQHKIRLWLSAPDPSLNYNRALMKRHEGTGSWLIKNPVFCDWKQYLSSDPLIWLYGIPGCGKSVLCSTVLEHVLHSCASIPDTAVLYFFFDFNDTEKQQHEGMMRSLLTQLFMHCVSVPPVLDTLYRSCMEGGRKPHFKEVVNTFYQMTIAFRTVFIILDALDECRERPELLADIEELSSWEDVDLRILATSRKEKEIEDSFVHLTKDESQICIQSALVNADIRAYVNDQLQTNKKLQRWQKKPEVQLEIENTLMDKAGGMFRWATCQLDSLGNCLTLPKLRKALETLPRTLNDTYARILCDIDEEYQQYALHILQWLAFSVRPLHLKEVAEVVAIDINDHPQFDPQRRLPDPEDVLEICSSLITVTQKSSDDDEFDCLESKFYECYVGLAHFSVKEYLISESICQGKAATFSLKERDCHLLLAKDCLAYLFHFDRVGSVTSNVFAEYPLAQYTTIYLPAHAQVAEKTDKAICQDLFLTKSEAFVNWVRLRELQHRFALDLPRSQLSKASPLYYACGAGLPISVKELLSNEATFNVQDEEYGNALIAASSKGYSEVVKLLLEKCSYFDNISLFYYTALRSAASQQYTEIEQMLLEKGAVENEVASDALVMAIRKRDREKAELLIKNEAATTRKDHYMVPLELASYKGLHGVVKLILDKHAIVDGKIYSTILAGASRRGRHKIVQLLLDKGAIIDIEVMKGGVDGEILEVILDNGGDPSLQDDQGRALCHYAAAEDSVIALDILLKSGADLTVIDKQGRTCLHHAVNKNIFPRFTALKWLLKQGFNPNTPDRDGWTPLHWAAKFGYTGIVEILEDAGAKLSIENIMGWTPRDVALSHHQRISWKIDTGFDPSVQRLKPSFDVGTSTGNPTENTEGVRGNWKIHRSQCCDGCLFTDDYGPPIFGPRHRCVTCVDSGVYFDYCFKCKQSSDATHPGHTFILVPNEA